jgi:hypothetical protein
MHPESRHKLMVGLAIVGCAIIAAILTFVIIKTFGGPKCCDPIAELSQLDINTVPNIPSADFRTLVAFAGYFKFKSKPTDGQHDETLDKYVRLNLTEVESKTNAKRAKSLTLNLNCANMTLQFVPQDEVLTVNSIKISLTNSQAEYIGSCMIGQTGIAVGTHESYFCYSKQEFPCELTRSFENDYGSVSLNVDILKFELDGNRKLIEKGQFSKPPKFCF